nr:MAG TPA: hypothetical protein [Caudoviricetes sp.]
MYPQMVFIFLLPSGEGNTLTLANLWASSSLQVQVQPLTSPHNCQAKTTNYNKKGSTNNAQESHGHSHHHHHES